MKDIIVKLGEVIERMRESGKEEYVVLTEEEYEDLREYMLFNTLSYEDALKFQKSSGYAVNYNGLLVKL